VDARSDLYSTGCLMYELLTGRPPFTGDSPVAIAYQHVRENPVPPSVVDPEIPSWADAIVLKAMAKDPADRYQSAAEMRMDVQRAMNGMAVAAPTRMDMYGRTQQMGGATMMAASPTTAVPPYGNGQDESDGGPPRRSYRALLWILGLLVVLGAVGALAYIMFGGSGKTYAVPLVQGLPQAKAVQDVSAAHLQPKVTDETSTTVAKGIVISTNPAEGNNVKAGTVVTLFVSSGQQQVTVPNVVGESASAAQSQLTRLGLTVKQVADSTSSQPAGTVTQQNPGGNAQVSPGSTVTISVSGGEVTVQSVVGDSAATAVSVLQGQGFQVVTKQGTQAGAAPGNVFAQTPAENTSVPQHSQVTIYVQSQPASPTANPTPSATQPSPTPPPTPTASTTGPGGNGNGNGGGGNGGGGNGGGGN
jgi:serine/threonine-protein kinase